MLATSTTAAVLGVEAQIVRVEADIAPGFPRFTMVGLPDSAVKESEARVRAALRNCGFDFKWDRRITVNLAPAGQRKSGSSFDLATAVGLLAADGAVLPALGRVLLVGELALDGAVRGVAGVLPTLLLARRAGLRAAVSPHREPWRSRPRPGSARLSRRLPGGGAFAPRRGRAAAAAARTSRRLRAGACAGPGRRPRTAARPTGARDRGGRRAQPALRRTARLGEDDARPPASRAPAAALARRSRRGRDRALGRGPGRRGCGGTTALPEPPPHDERRRPRRRRPTPPAWRGQPRAPRCSLPRRAARVPPDEPRGPSPAARGRLRHGQPAPRHPAPAGAVPARGGDEPLPLWPTRGSVGVPMHGRRCALLPLPALGAAPRPDRPPRAGRRPGLRRDDRAGPRSRRPPCGTGCWQLASARNAGRLRPAPISNALLTSRALRRVARPGPAGERLLRRAVDRNGLTARGFDRLLRVARTIADLAGRDEVTASDLAEALQFRACLIDSLEVADSKILEKED